MTNSVTKSIVRFFATHHTSETLRLRFWNWLVSPSDDRGKQEALGALWETETPMSEAELRLSYETVAARAGIITHRTAKASMVRRLLRVAALLAVPLFSAAGAWFYVHSHQHATHLVECATATGQRRSVVLPDGTVVTMNAESFMVFPSRFDGASRTVYLSGEANFDVHKDAEHPFIVKAGRLAIQALGTKFDVEAYPEDSRIVATLERGKVRVTNMLWPRQTYVMHPNEQLVYDMSSRQCIRRDRSDLW